MKERQNEQLDGKTYRQMVANSSRDQSDNLAVGFGRLNEAMDDLRRNTQSGPVMEREPAKDPLLLRPILALLTLAAVISGCAGVISGLGGIILWQAWLVFLVTGGPRLAYAYYKYRKEQAAWVSRMEQNK